MSDSGTRALVVKRVHEEAREIRAFDVLPEGSEDCHELAFAPGQVAVLEVEGKGRAYFAIASAPEHFCYRDETDSWKAAGVELRQVVSRPDGYEWAGPTGYVQSLLDHVLPGLADPFALVCGSREMIEQTRARLREMGFEPERILTNY